MTDKEFKRLNRSQLIDIIYQLQLKQEELTADNEKLSKALADKRLRVSKAGNIAEAALDIHNVMQAAQDAADHYLEEIKIRAKNDYQRILIEARTEAAAMIANAKKEAEQILAQTQTAPTDYDPVGGAILKERKRVNKARVKTHETYEEYGSIPTNQTTS